MDLVVRVTDTQEPHPPVLERDEVIERIVAALENGRSVAVEGAFGIGKSTVLREVYRRFKDRDRPVEATNALNLNAIELIRDGLVILDEIEVLLWAEETAFLRFAEILSRADACLFSVQDWNRFLEHFGERLPKLQETHLETLTPLSSDGAAKLLRSHVTGLDDDKFEPLAGVLRSNPRLLGLFAAQINRYPKIRNQLETLPSRAIPALLLEHLPDHFVSPRSRSNENREELLPRLAREARALWKRLESHRVVQLSLPPTEDGFLVPTILALAKMNDHESFTAFSLPGATTISASESLFKALDTSNPVDWKAIPYCGPAIERTWYELDQAYGTSAARAELLAPKRLVLLKVGTVSPVRDMVDWQSSPPINIDIAELVDAVLSAKKSRTVGLKLLLLSRDSRLSINLPAHLCRQKPEFNFPCVELTGSYLRNSYDLEDFAIRKVWANDEIAQDMIRRQVSGVATTADIPGWAVGLRRLRRNCLRDLSFLPDISPIPEGLEAVPLHEDVTSFLEELSHDRTVAVSSAERDFAAHWTRGCHERAASLLGDENGRGFLAAWVEDRLLLKVSQNPETHNAFIAGDFMYAPQRGFELSRHGRDRFPDERRFRERMLHLALPVAKAFIEWLSTARALVNGGYRSQWMRSVGLERTPSTREMAAYLLAVEVSTPEEFEIEWLGAVRRSSPTATPDFEGRVQKSLDLTERVAAYLEELLGDEVVSFLESAFPESRGKPRRRLEEWLLDRRWRHKLGDELGDWVGAGRLRRVLGDADAAGVKSDSSALACELLGRWGVPEIPRFRSTRADVASWLDSLSHTDIDTLETEALHGLMVSLYQICEAACMEAIIAYAEAFPEYERKLVDKLTKKGWAKPEQTWRECVTSLDLGRLTSCFGTFVSRIAPGKVWHDWFETHALGGSSLHWNDLHGELERLRKLRGPFVHARYDPASTNDPDLRNAAHKVLDTFLRVCDAGFVEFIPKLVCVIGLSSDDWGKHADLIDAETKELRAYQISIQDDMLGRRFYLISDTNPRPVRPLLIPIEK